MYYVDFAENALLVSLDVICRCACARGVVVVLYRLAMLQCAKGFAQLCFINTLKGEQKFSNKIAYTKRTKNEFGE